MKIGELSRRTNCEITTIRYWESQNLLSAPSRSQGNFRLYDEGHVNRLLFIRHCRSFDMPLEEVRDFLRFYDSPESDCVQVNERLDVHLVQLKSRLRELLELKRNLIALRRQCSGHKTMKKCKILQALEKWAGRITDSK